MSIAESIIYLWLLPVFAQLLLPLVMLLVYGLSRLLGGIFQSVRPPTGLESHAKELRESALPGKISA